MKINTHLDFQGNEIKLAAPEKVTTLPDSNLFIGRTCVLISEKEVDDTTISVGSIYYYNGEQWCNIEGESLKIDETKINVIDDEITLHTFDTLADTKTYIKSNTKPKSVIIGSNAGITSIGNDAFVNCTSLTSITIPNSVTSIGNSTFYGCKSLKSITIPNGVTSIGSSTFYECASLASIIIPGSVTSIGKQAFNGCTSLTSIDIYSGVTSIGDKAFNGCTSLTSITISNGVTSIGSQAFKDCTSLTAISLPDSVTSINFGTFSGCTSLTTIYMPKYVTSIGNSAFANCSSLKSIFIPNSVTTSIGSQAFENCTSLASITIPSSVTSIGDYIFRNCTSLASITIPNGVTKIGSQVFQNCTSLTAITIPSGVTSIGSQAFENCTSLTSITIPDSVTSINSNAFTGCDILLLDDYKSRTGYPWGAADILIHNEDVTTTIDASSTDRQVPTAKTVYDALSSSGSSLDETKINVIDDEIALHTFNTLADAKTYIDSNDKPKSVIIGSNAGVTSIGNYAFNWCTSLTSITIPSGVTSIGKNAFQNCYSLASITIPNSVTSIGKDAFSSCYSLTSITIPNSVTSIGSNAFQNCEYLTSITIPSSITSIGDYTFDGCTSLTYIAIPSGVTSIGMNAFYGCTSLTSITIPSSVTSIGMNAFTGCTSLTSITIPNSVTSIGSNAFANCTSLASITIPNGVTSIGNNTFSDCYSLASITIPSSVTSIGISAFKNCTSLTSITIPNGVTSIGSQAFRNCTSLTSITIPDSVTSIGNNAFQNCDVLLLDNYKTRTGYPWGATKILIQNEDVTTTIDENSTDRQVPTAKAVYDNITSIKEDVDTKFDNIDVSNSIGNSENLANGDDVSYCRGFGEMKYTWDLPSGETEIGGKAFLDWNQIIFPVTPGETIYMNCVLGNLTITYFDSEKEFVTTNNCMSDNFVVPSNDNIAYVGIPVKGCAMVGFVFSREPIGQDSGDLDAIYMREIRQTNETEYTADYDGTWGNSNNGYHRSRRYITTHQQVERLNVNKFTPNLYSRTAPNGNVAYNWWEAYYMKRGNCDMSYGDWSQTAFAALDTNTGTYSYGIYDPQLYKTSDTVKKIGEYYNGIDILAKTKSGEFLTLDIQTDEITKDLTFGLLVFRNNIGGELGAFSRVIANATDPNATHITNYGTLVNGLTNQDGKFFRYKRVKKRITDDYITYTREGDSEPFYKFSITEIKNIIDTNGTIDWNAFTQDELDNWEDGHKEIKYSGNDFDFNVSGIVLYKGVQQYQMQFIRSFASIAPVKTRAYDAAMNSSSSAVAGSQWKGKKWYAYGTSMTDANYHGYVDRLTSVSGLTCKNFGLGGSGIIPSLHSSDNIKTRCMRTSDGKTEADLITIEIIPNDMSGTLGTSTDTGDTTFCGNLNQILQYLQENTTAQIVVLIATRSRYLYNNTSTKYPPTSEQVTKWMEWVSATEEVCKRNCVQCWDGSSQCGLGYYRVGGETTDTKYVKDQIHLTPLGAKNLADYFWSRLQNLPLFYSS